MTIVKVGKSIDENASLWRYITLEAFIDLLDTESLFFSPTAYYQKTDPFEGLLPEVALKADASIGRESFSDMKSIFELIKKKAEDKYGGTSEQKQRMIDTLDNSIEKFRFIMRKSFPAIAKGLTVSCWHKNKSESEAMWRLYSNNGIAIKSSVNSIKKSFEDNGENHIIHVAPVKYIDFNDKNITPADCISDGYRIGLIKRASFSHENEVRFFISPKLDIKNPEKHKPLPIKVKINASILIEKVYISPFSAEPFISSVYAICRKYNISNEIVVRSKLLRGHEELLNTLIL